MFRNPKEFFLTDVPLDVDKSGETTSIELKVAVLVLLQTMANKDNHLAVSEFTQILDLLKTAFGSDEDETRELMELSSKMTKENPKLTDYVDRLNAAYSTAQRQKVFAMVWQVAFADRTLAPEETAFSHELRSQLHLSGAEAQEARQAIENT